MVHDGAMTDHVGINCFTLTGPAVADGGSRIVGLPLLLLRVRIADPEAQKTWVAGEKAGHEPDVRAYRGRQVLR